MRSAARKHPALALSGIFRQRAIWKLHHSWHWAFVTGSLASSVRSVPVEDGSVGSLAVVDGSPGSPASGLLTHEIVRKAHESASATTAARRWVRMMTAVASDAPW